MSEADELLRLREALAGAVAELTDDRRLMVIDLARAGVVVWDLYRDLTGTPQGAARPTMRWSDLSAGMDHEEQALLGAIRPGEDTAMVVVCTHPQDVRNTKALEWLGRRYSRAEAFTSEVALDGLLRGAVANEPLTRFYELVVLRHSASGRLELTGRPLFPIGARRGDREQLTVRCAASDDSGTVFAVVAYSQETRFQLVSAQSVKLPPGRYELTAELRRPGLVRFHGLPGQAALSPEPRGWAELVSMVPDRLDPSSDAVHLICAVEISGPDDRVALRLSAAQRLVLAAAAEPAEGLLVSVISYGPHSLRRGAPEVPVTVLGWRESADWALEQLRKLEEGGGVDLGYPFAAQLECVLREVAERLERETPSARTKLLTVGARPAFPRRVNHLGILPCPGKRDWEAELRRLREHPGIAFGAILDRETAETGEETAIEAIWEQLGGLPAELDGLDVERLAEALRLAPAARARVPFPLIEAL